MLVAVALGLGYGPAARAAEPAPWVGVPSAPIPASPVAFLHSVSCSAPSDCWAMGGIKDGDVTRLLAEHWDGVAWTRVALPEPGGVINLINEVSCAARDRCLAAGYGYDTLDQPEHTLALLWDGKRWRLLPRLAGTAGQGDILWAATCPASGDCLAVGESKDAADLKRTLVVRAGPAGLTRLASPNARQVDAGVYGTASSTDTPLTKDVDNTLEGVACASATACWAVGLQGGMSLALRWNGTTWQVVATPNNTPVEGANLDGVSCVSDSDCWAVGSYAANVVLGGGPYRYYTFAIHWDGASWTKAATPNADGATANGLSGVTCLAADDCRAVGTGYGTKSAPLLVRWNGTSWGPMPTRSLTPNSHAILDGLACAPLAAQAQAAEPLCFAVGQTFDIAGARVGAATPLVAAPEGATPTQHAPTVTLAAAPAAGPAPLAVTFTATGADADPGQEGGLIYAYDLDGDGVFEGADDPAPTRRRTYTEPGTFTVRVRVTDPFGAPGEASTTVRVDTPPPPSATANAFVFAERSGVATSVFVTSEPVTPVASGRLPIGVAGGASMQYSLNGGAFTGDAGTVGAGDRLTVRHRSANGDNTTVTTTVTVGDYAASFRSTTGTTLDRAPDAFDFGVLSSVAPGTLVPSPSVTPINYDSAQVSAGPGLSYRLDGGAWTTATGTIRRGQSVQVRLTSSPQSLGYARSYLAIGGVRGAFTVRTRK